MSKLVQIGRASSAASTEFVCERLDGPGGLHIWLDGNQKVSGWNPRPNAFSLLAGNGEIGDELGHQREHCPGSTPTCRAACYVHGLAKHAGSTYDLYAQNSHALREILTDPTLARAWAHHLGDWIDANCVEIGFRWHVSGDVVSMAHARWIVQVADHAWDVMHWIYTRSFDFVEPLGEAATVRGGNIALNLSCDRDNLERAVDVRDTLAWWSDEADRWVGPRLCYLTRDGEVPAEIDPFDDVIFPDYALRGVKNASPGEQRASSPWYQELGAARRAVCPVDFYGKSERVRCGEGACTRCLR